MKRFLFVPLVFVFLPCLNIHGQALVFDAAVHAFMTASQIETVIHYATMVKDNIMQIAQFKEMIEHAVEQGKRAVQNLQGMNDINSFDDFMDWYNRQLYLERRTVDTFKEMKVTVGKKHYSLTDIDGIAHGAKDTYVDYWDKEFTEDQRREMWRGLGLTASNYAYVQPFRQKAVEISRHGLTAPEIQNEWYVRNMERNNERQEKMVKDKNKDADDKMGQNEYLAMLLESSMENNRVLNDIAMNQTLEMERQAVEKYLADTPADAPPLSEWPEDVFRPLSK
jgi:hypothetical protein